MNVKFIKAGFNNKAKFRLLRNAVLQYPDIEQFDLFRSLKTYVDIKVELNDFDNGHSAFISHVQIVRIPSTPARFSLCVALHILLKMSQAPRKTARRLFMDRIVHSRRRRMSSHRKSQTFLY